MAQERIDDATRRILRVKQALGLFEQLHTDVKLLDTVGSAQHRALAREAASKSAVLLKNESAALPLHPGSDVLVMGEAADDIGLQCGGWTISWMGSPGAVTPGTTVLEGLRANGLHPTYDAGAWSTAQHQVGLVVVAEEPYAEGMGDRSRLELSPAHLELLSRARARCKQLVVVLFSGRPLVISNQLPEWDAFVAAFLPGSEGNGVADVLTGARSFSGKLSFDWPLTGADVARHSTFQTLFRLGDGLT